MLDAQLDGQLGGAVEFERQRVAQFADAAENVLGQQAGHAAHADVADARSSVGAVL